ncbi:MAG: hypothetical protein D6685_02230 [Bacteroidetes bacterium]|nr:MAG: hypothetical protein D6685_02230 [Bacteroidota bacterium]
MPRPASSIACLFGSIALLFGTPGAVPAQPVAFGAWDDPSEQLQEVWWRRESSLDVMSGLSLIAAQWRGAASLSANLVTRPVTARLRGTVRAGTLGRYRPDLDEPYDALRLLEFMRFTPPRRSATHVRIGLINRTRLGTGHLMDFYRSDMAWDERTVGAEMYHAWGFGAIEALTDNLLLDRVVGGRLMLQPLGWTGSPRFGSLRLGVSYVTDLQTHRADARPLIGYNVDASFDAFNSGSIVLQPFASVAWYRHQGRGLAFGATVDSPNFIDLARFHLRMVLYYSGEAFIPGYFGAFYTVHNPHARILNGERFLADSTAQRVVGVPLEAARGGNAFATELRVHIFQQFELWYFFRRHYGTQALSDYHLRLYLHARNRLRLGVGADRGGLRGFGSLFSDLGDQAALVFNLDYRLAGAMWLFVHARYTYERRSDAPDGSARYLVQRRFEPLTGFRVRL